MSLETFNQSGHFECSANPLTKVAVVNVLLNTANHNYGAPPVSCILCGSIFIHVVATANMTNYDKVLQYYDKLRQTTTNYAYIDHKGM